ncbi:ATP-dependent RNA helicase SUPV3L1/SUV3 [Nitrospirillum amazonense]|uniref:ATP-dependent RNA helicase SUPV3L1/SUV3 n=2 Tax=Nitrospirillum amazonense TaxID=28077 RepID=A0A560FAJ5_9PROT|nr:ATP-dependent RNA helicase SUPV3L1/SUV3 [Nitrospirillum amazonense]
MGGPPKHGVLFLGAAAPTLSVMSDRPRLSPASALPAPRRAADSVGALPGGRVVAVLGPTNTGKTYLAMERMLAHASGMMGFPLRLLARENYDKVVRAKGAGQVALVTGEEKIIPPGARYWICTVESMPLDHVAQFLAVDEIQLAADPERGHIFTDRLLHARGTEETMFLGSDTIKPLLQKLIPKAEFVSRPRFSSLTYSGHKKLTKLPPRAAVVAFSAADVYGLAELLRRTRGGTAVVLGALSPRTRNAQVQLYQEGAVDYLVATDAIGMGLNMDVDHVAFARLSKFDGQQPRRLRAPEVAQIAGRAGRHLTDGTFGTTDEAPSLDPELIDAVENHKFETLKTLMWRNVDLDFRSPQALLRALEERPPSPVLIRAREADDHLALQALAQDADLMRLANNPLAVRLLWEVCQIPDFRKVLSDAHTRLLSQIFKYLRDGPAGTLPLDWVAAQVARLDRGEGDIDTLVSRIAHIRTWTYISHRPGWLDDAVHWQERTRAIEDRLSDALHERLTQRFVDKRSAGLVKRLADGRDLMGAVDRDGRVLVEGHPVGRLHGVAFQLDADVPAADAKAITTAARRALGDVIAQRVRALEAAPDAAITLDGGGELSWDGAVIGVLAPGPTPLAPLVRLVGDDFLQTGQREPVRARLARWVEAHVARVLSPLTALAAAARGGELSGAGRGIAFQVAEALGGLPRAALEPLIATLTKEDRRRLAALGLRLGFSQVFLTALTRPVAVALRGLLWSVAHATPMAVPPPGRVTLAVGDLPPDFLAAIGYVPLGSRALRIDMVDRLEKSLAGRAKAGPLVAVDDLVLSLGVPRAEVPSLMSALGYRLGQPKAEGEPAPWLRRRPKPAPAPAAAKPDPAPAAPKPGKKAALAPQPAPPGDHPFSILRTLVEVP